MIAQVLVSVFKEWTYVLIAAVVGLLVFVLATWLANLDLIWQIAVSPSVPLLDKTKILASLVGSIRTNFTVMSALYIIAIAVLFGLNTAMVTYYVRKKKRLNTQTGRAGAVAGVGGLASGLLGIGCAACGTLALGPVLSLLGAAGILALLPFDGQEFGWFGVGMLVISIFMVAQKIREPLVCAIRLEEEA